MYHQKKATSTAAMTLELRISDDTYDQLRKRAKEQGYEDPEAYGSMIIEVVLDELESTTSDDVQDRLRDLGYID